MVDGYLGTSRNVEPIVAVHHVVEDLDGFFPEEEPAAGVEYMLRDVWLTTPVLASSRDEVGTKDAKDSKASEEDPRCGAGDTYCIPLRAWGRFWRLR